MGAGRGRGWLLSVAAVVVAMVTVTGVQSSRQAERAAVSTDRADAQRLCTLALAELATDRALLYAVQAVRLDGTPATRSVLLSVLSRSPQLIGVRHVPPSSVGPTRNAVLSHRGDRSASAIDRTVAVWDVRTGDRIEHLYGHNAGIRTLEFGPDDATLISTDETGTVLTWDLRGDRRFAPRYPDIEPVRGARTTMVARPDGTAVASVGSRPGATWLRIVNLAGSAGSAPFGMRAGGRISPVWRPDGARLATTDSEGLLATWDPATGALLDGHASLAWIRAALAYTPDGQTILAASRGGRVYRVDGDSLALDGDLVEVGDRLGVIAAGPRGRLAAVLGAAARSEDRLTRYAVIDLAASRVLRRGTLDFDATALAFAPDGRRLAIAGQMGELMLLDIRTGRPARPTVIGHNASVLSVAYSADGSRIVTGGYDGRVVLWHARTGEVLGSLRPGAAGTATRPIFLPDGHTVLIPAEDGSVARWDARPAAWLAFACRVAARDMTAAEWERALGDRPYRKTC